MDKSRLPRWGKVSNPWPEKEKKKKKKGQVVSGAYTPRKKRKYLKKIEEVFD